MTDVDGTISQMDECSQKMVFGLFFFAINGRKDLKFQDKLLQHCIWSENAQP